MGRGLSASGFIPIDGSICRAPFFAGRRAVCPGLAVPPKVVQVSLGARVASHSCARSGMRSRSNNDAKLGEAGRPSKRISPARFRSLRGGGDGLYKLEESRRGASALGSGLGRAGTLESRGTHGDRRTKRRHRGTCAILYERRVGGGSFFSATTTNPFNSIGRLRGRRLTRGSRPRREGRGRRRSSGYPGLGPLPERPGSRLLAASRSSRSPPRRLLRRSSR